MTKFRSLPDAHVTGVTPDPAPNFRGGRPAYEPTDKERAMVKLLVAAGVVQARIAEALGTSEPTLRKHFHQEILLGKTEIDAKAVNALVRAMDSNQPHSVTASKFWCERRMGWTEKLSIDDSRPETTRFVVELVGEPAPAAVKIEHEPQDRSGFDAARRHVQLVG